MTKLEYVRSILKGWSLTFDHLARFATARPIEPIWVQPWEETNRLGTFESDADWGRVIDAMRIERGYQMDRLAAARRKAAWLMGYVLLLAGFQALAFDVGGIPGWAETGLTAMSAYAFLAALMCGAGNYLAGGSGIAEVARSAYNRPDEYNRLGANMEYTEGTINTIATDCNTVVEWVGIGFLCTAAATVAWVQ